VIDELSPNLPQSRTNAIHAALLRINEKKFDGAEPNVCLKEAYDVFATLLRDLGQNLTKHELHEKIPAWVLRWAVRNQWLKEPWLLLEVGAVSESKSFVTFGDCQTSKEARADILKRLASRISRWEAVAIELGSIGNATGAAEAVEIVPAELPSESHQSVVGLEANHLALVDAFIQRVHRETGTHIKKVHIWRAAGYSEPSEFHRFQRNDPKTSAKGTERFKTILGMESQAFLKLRQRK